jgi:excisionase family DNA binding protein
MNWDRKGRDHEPPTLGIEPLIDASEAARLLRLHPVTLREFAKQGRIPGIQIGRAWRFRISTLNAWITSQENGK